jgi:hypothetical protein
MPRGRQPILDEILIARLVEWIDMRWTDHQRPRLKRTRLFMEEKCEISISKTTLHHIFQPIYTYSVSSMDTERLNLSDDNIYTWFPQLQLSNDSVPAHFVHNVDEICHQEFYDAKQRLCVAPAHVIKDACYEI